MALLHDDAEWAVNDIIDWDRYFAALRPAVVQDDFGALAACSVDFHLRSIGRHDDDRADAEPPSGDGDASRVIARGECDDAARPLLRGELEQPVARAPELECAAGLQALALEPDPLPGDFALDQRGAVHLPRDPPRGCEHVLASDWPDFG